MRTLFSAAVVLLVFAGCGGSNDESTAASPTPTASATEAPQQASAGPAKVRIDGFAYKPAVLKVEKGAKVTWTDDDSANHTVTFDKGPGDLGNVDPGDSVSATFDERGTFPYVCQYHPNMKGTVTVR